MQGYLIVATKRWGSDLTVWALNIAAGVNWQAVISPLLRALQNYGMQIPTLDLKRGHCVKSASSWEVPTRCMMH